MAVSEFGIGGASFGRYGVFFCVSDAVWKFDVRRAVFFAYARADGCSNSNNSSSSTSSSNSGARESINV